MRLYLRPNGAFNADFSAAVLAVDEGNPFFEWGKMTDLRPIS